MDYFTFSLQPIVFAFKEFFLHFYRPYLYTAGAIAVIEGRSTVQFKVVGYSIGPPVNHCQYLFCIDLELFLDKLLILELVLVHFIPEH